MLITSYHESGHLLLAEWYGARVIFASSLPDEHSGTRAHGLTKAVWATTEDPCRRAVQLAKVALAGPAAELIYTDEQYEPQLLQAWWTDWDAANEAIQQLVPRPLKDRQCELVLSQFLHELIRFLSKDEIWGLLAGIADELEAHETLDQFQLAELRAQGRLSVAS